MKRIIVFGNSASGKSSLAKKLSLIHKLAHLDLDTLAWQLDADVPKRASLANSKKVIDSFIQGNDNWVIEGCYADLLSLVTKESTQAYFMDLPISECIENAKKRPWEPHKYESKQAQDANLDMLIEWIRAYETREDCFSKQAHMALYDAFEGEKTRIVRND
ncbi:AAA family ATPase [Marinomonas sp. MED121]|uniref:AAA family ATPase n=1 Tax=Marinomonas sp. MED121 TaxID=314277 RepID=UPI00055EE6A6|nr:AAA family ATPase [Marinomonas sp. MED121]